MRVLWLTFTATVNPENVDSKVAERGWIISLENNIKNLGDIQLGVGFFHENNTDDFVSGGINYYPIKMKYQSFFGKLYQRLFSELYDSNTARLRTVIDAFKPDVIHLFGTESGMVEALHFTSVPVIVHLQGLVRPYLSVWFPKGMSQTSVSAHTNLWTRIRMVGYLTEYRLFKKKAVREDKAIEQAHYFFGRTQWDRQYIHLRKLDYTYFHCEEDIRSCFKERTWSYPKNAVFRIISVINPQLYKGLEIILETACILKELTIPIEWNIVGISHSDALVSVIEGISNAKFSNCEVYFKGVKSGEELVDELINSNLFVHTSHIENSPNSICEAMIVGMPVVAGNVGGNSSLISHNEDGILYSSYETYALASIVKRATETPELLIELGRKARERALVRHDSESIAATVYKAYSEVLNG